MWKKRNAMQPSLDLNPAVTSNFHHLPSSCRPVFLQQAASSKQQAASRCCPRETGDRHGATVPICHGLLPALLHLPLQCSVPVAAPWALALTSHLSISSFRMVQCGGLGISKPSEHTSPSMFHRISVSDSRALQNPESIHRSFRFRE
jgi:hypothetical protein